jgi:hypothetical protein
MTTNPTPHSERVTLLRSMVKGIYDLQLVRMQMGVRLCDNFRSRLGLKSDAPISEDLDPDEAEAEKKRRDKEANRILDMLRDNYKRLTDGIAKNRSIPDQAAFAGSNLISTPTEYTLIGHYEAMVKTEEAMFRSLEVTLNTFPIYTSWLSQQKGVGPAMAGVIISYLDPYRARHVSSFWKYAGLDVGPDGRGRSRRAEHLVVRTYTDRNGDEKERNGLTYEPFLKTKLMGVLSGSFLRTASPWRRVYDDYKHRLMTDPAREKVTVAQWKRRRKAGEDVARLWAPGRVDFASKRYMVKMFLQELWIRWRTLEGLPVSDPYSVAKQGRPPHAA